MSIASSRSVLLVFVTIISRRVVVLDISNMLWGSGGGGRVGVGSDSDDG